LSGSELEKRPTEVERPIPVLEQRRFVERRFLPLWVLPVFFAFTGLRTQIGLLNSAQDWLICLVVTAGATDGSAPAARLTGMKWRESLHIGALMNTRGLMELIALNIGYDMGILSQHIYHNDGTTSDWFWENTRDGWSVSRAIA
jgi:Kef-type K+ transport system membrane component KefB